MVDFTELWEKTIQSQYGASPHIKGIIESFAKLIDPTGDIDEFYQKVYDPRTAEGIGLDIWGIIVGANRFISVEYADVINFFGFDGSDLQPFNLAPFWTQEGSTLIYRMSDAAFRQMIFLKAAANIGNATLPFLKTMLNQIYDRSTIINLGNMHVRVIFENYNNDPYAFAILTQYGLLPLGAGVGWEYYIADPTETFGFDGSEMQPFDQGIFVPDDIVQVNQ